MTASKASEIFQNGLLAVAVLAAVAVASVVVIRELRGTSESSRATLSPVFHDDWREYAGAGQWVGSPDAPVVILEFADFECPACREFALKAMRGARSEFGDSVALLFRHFPLAYHAQARPAAIAAECAGQQGKFEPFHDLLYEDQGSLGVRTVSDLAREVGIADQLEFDRCIARPEMAAIVDTDLNAARELGARGTPTILVNGKLIDGSPDSAAFIRVVKEALLRETPLR